MLQAISPLKDVDGFHSENVGGLAQGRDVLTPCPQRLHAPAARRLRRAARASIAVVVGRSNLLSASPWRCPAAAGRLHGAPWCTRAAATCSALCRQADILVAAVGKPRLIGADWLKPGAVVIDVGINRVDDGGHSRLVGDVDFAAALPQVAGITPVPGGVGPMTIAYLMKNTLLALDLQQQAAHQERTACLSPC